MAITESINYRNEKEFTIYVNLRSKVIPTLRLQKRVKGIKTFNEAIRVEKSIIKDFMTKIAHKEGHGFTWRMVVLQWASSVSSEREFEVKYNPATIIDYVSMMNNWTKSWLDRPASEISRGEGREVLNLVLVQGRTKAFQKRLKNTINMIFNWGIENKLIRNINHSPVYGLKISLREERRPEIFTSIQIRELLSKAKESQNSWYPVWVTALLTGMRNGELYALKWEDINFEQCYITVQRSFNKRVNEFKSTKSGHWRTVPISKDLLAVIINLKKVSTNEFVLPRLIEWSRGEQAKYLKIFCKSINLPPVKFHTLRALFCDSVNFFWSRAYKGYESSRLARFKNYGEVYSLSWNR